MARRIRKIGNEVTCVRCSSVDEIVGEALTFPYICAACTTREVGQTTATQVYVIEPESPPFDFGTDTEAEFESLTPDTNALIDDLRSQLIEANEALSVNAKQASRERASWLARSEESSQREIKRLRQLIATHNDTLVEQAKQFNDRINEILAKQGDEQIAAKAELASREGHIKTILAKLIDAEKKASWLTRSEQTSQKAIDELNQELELVEEVSAEILAKQGDELTEAKDALQRQAVEKKVLGMEKGVLQGRVKELTRQTEVLLRQRDTAMNENTEHLGTIVRLKAGEAHADGAIRSALLEAKNLRRERNSALDDNYRLRQEVIRLNSKWWTRIF